MTRALLLLLALAGCAPPPQSDAGCLAYGAQRATMPPLGMSDLDAWVATLDSALTAACFP